jgi:O-antigen/teichoic acid export membrane protein
MGSLLRVILKNSSLTFASSIISQILMLFFYSIIAKSLSSEVFGLITFNLTTIQLFAILSSGGIGLAIAKFISEKRDNIQNENEVISISLKLNVIFIFISLLTMFFFKKQLGIQFTYVNSSLMFIGVISISIDALLKSILIGKQDFSSLAKITIYNSLITFSINILGFYFFGSSYIYITYIYHLSIKLLF